MTPIEKEKQDQAYDLIEKSIIAQIHIEQIRIRQTQLYESLYKFYQSDKKHNWHTQGF